MSSPAPPSPAVTIVTQTRVDPAYADQFAQWQAEIQDLVGRAAGFINQSVIPPSPPAQVDWVILQKFADAGAATAWLNSERRLALIAPGRSRCWWAGTMSTSLRTAPPG